MLTTAAELNLLKLLFWNQDWPGIGDAGGLRGSAGAGSWYVSLHSADPGSFGDQASNEVLYTGYARVALPRNSGVMAVGGAQPADGANVGALTFPACTAGSAGATWLGIGPAASGPGQLVFKGLLSAPLNIAPPVIPQVPVADLMVRVL